MWSTRDGPGVAGLVTRTWRWAGGSCSSPSAARTDSTGGVLRSGRRVSAAARQPLGSGAKQTMLAARQKSAPRFVVAVRSPGTAVVVRDLRTGKIVDETMPPPQGRRYHQVASAPDGTYIVSSFGGQRVGFHRLRLAADG